MEASVVVRDIEQQQEASGLALAPMWGAGGTL